MKKDRVFLILAMAVTAFIFYNSLQSATVSSGTSKGLLSGIIEAIPFLKPVLSHNMLRKAAHMSEFFVQGLFLTLWAVYSKNGLRSNLFTVAFSGLFIACCDEFLQTFSDGRSPEVRDVFIDFAGTVTAIGIVALIFFVRRRRKHVR